MNGKQKTIWIWVVSLLLVLVMLAAVWYAHQSRQQDWWNGFTENTTRPDFSGKTVPTDEISVNIGSLFPEEDTASGTAADEDGDTADTADTAGTVKTTANTAVTEAGTTASTTREEDGDTVTAGSRFDNMVNWGDLHP